MRKIQELRTFIDHTTNKIETFIGSTLKKRSQDITTKIGSSCHRKDIKKNVTQSFIERRLFTKRTHQNKRAPGITTEIETTFHRSYTMRRVTQTCIERRRFIDLRSQTAS
jgi:hypothetical protein